MAVRKGVEVSIIFAVTPLLAEVNFVSEDASSWLYLAITAASESLALWA